MSRETVGFCSIQHPLRGNEKLKCFAMTFPAEPAPIDGPSLHGSVFGVEEVLGHELRRLFAWHSGRERLQKIPEFLWQ